jgi:hypothetical protein
LETAATAIKNVLDTLNLSPAEEGEGSVTNNTIKNCLGAAENIIAQLQALQEHIKLCRAPSLDEYNNAMGTPIEGTPIEGTSIDEEAWRKTLSGIFASISTEIEKGNFTIDNLETLETYRSDLNNALGKILEGPSSLSSITGLSLEIEKLLLLKTIQGKADNSSTEYLNKSEKEALLEFLFGAEEGDSGQGVQGVTQEGDSGQDVQGVTQDGDSSQGVTQEGDSGQGVQGIAKFSQNTTSNGLKAVLNFLIQNTNDDDESTKIKYENILQEQVKPIKNLKQFIFGHSYYSNFKNQRFLRNK